MTSSTYNFSTELKNQVLLDRDSDGDGFSNREEIDANKEPGDKESVPSISVALQGVPALPKQIIRNFDATFVLTLVNTSPDPVPLTGKIIATDRASGDEIAVCSESFPTKLPQNQAVTKRCAIKVDSDKTVSFMAELQADGGAKESTQPQTVELKAVDTDVLVALEPTVAAVIVESVVRGEPFTLASTITNRTSLALKDVEVRLTRWSEAAPFCTLSVTELAASAEVEGSCSQVVESQAGVQIYEAQILVGGVAQGSPLLHEITVDERRPALGLAIKPETPVVPSGSNVRFKAQVTNQGNVELANVNVASARLSHCTQTIGTLASGAEQMVECQGPVTGEMVEVRNGRPLFIDVITAEASETYGPPEGKVRQEARLLLNAAFLNLLPIVSRPVEAPQVDLIVRDFALHSEGATVQIQNIGEDSLPAGTAFWVDLYIAPKQAPTGVNQTADDFSGHGLIWGVILERALMSQDFLMLSVYDRYFDTARSRYPTEIEPGSAIYVQADSAHQNSSYGSVFETHEQNNGLYNNIASQRLTAAVSTTRWTERRAGSGLDAGNIIELPRRIVHP